MNILGAHMDLCAAKQYSQSAPIPKLEAPGIEQGKIVILA